MTRRTQRVASLVRSILAEAIQWRLNDPRIPPITSITRVEVSPDFALARVYVSVLAPEQCRVLCLRALRGSAAHLRRMLGQELCLRRIPTLDFRLDDSLRRGFETVQLIDRLMGEADPGRPEAPADERPAVRGPGDLGDAGPPAAAGDDRAREDA